MIRTQVTHTVEIETDSHVGFGKIVYDEGTGMYIGIVNELPVTDYAVVPVNAIYDLTDYLSEGKRVYHRSVIDVG